MWSFDSPGETKSAEVRFKETYKGDRWDGARPDEALKDATLSVTLEPGEARDVEIIWDSSGYAWYDDGRPRLVQRLKAELWENSKMADEMTKNLKVRPKPIVIVPGIWTDAIQPSDRSAALARSPTAVALLPARYWRWKDCSACAAFSCQSGACGPPPHPAKSRTIRASESRNRG